ncbi:hypothetical protein SEA_SNAPTAP_87 [Mycobacterium phage SnapTap]|uniref:Uncharacterized protein n=1 Tax=Mycobacterium phage Georgie2 TaxID=2743928 RepID=A0A7D5JHI8_9CAUD|nr:hypothetical protein PBI_SWEETIEPIE_87 [Mycobacterium phage SweetiePie]YP_010063895.1 hypothetical protein KIY84_gp88 [Mycobacterium phage Georgie2]AIS73850.1 hypothetical protein PBI_POWER_87 [Mycobacterium phage Power]ATN91932.1 hypothetical protein SEA_SNAPTAP_87 [Mycobacterium phage SnapTap]AXC33228.1 hypothetical protein SEA_CRUCIO_87 [Mycobacterium phage Crucio]QGJ89033.1 hypothetical protein SEA_QUEENB2_84 [Mycobacterium phage QueenB2]AIT13561.1 hypothetical protein PBI_SWEETIEPIE_8
MTVIEAAHYGENQRALQQDPIVVAMSVEMNAAPANVKASWTHNDGGPTFEFMQIANREFDRRGGTGAESIGAVAKALLANLAILEGKA